MAAAARGVEFSASSALLSLKRYYSSDEEDSVQVASDTVQLAQIAPDSVQRNSKSTKLKKDQIAGGSSSVKEESFSLDHKQRPKELQEVIDKVFDKLTFNLRVEWTYDGAERYSICKIDEYALMKRLIIEGYKKGQRDFYAWDIGAGDRRWGYSLADSIDRDPQIPENISLDIFSIVGENLGDSDKKTRLCRIHNIGVFKIEELGAEFKKRGIDLKNKVDLAVSRLCFQHLADPAGTFIQALQLIRPRTGFFLLNGFWFLYKGQTGADISNKQMLQFALDTGSRFLVRKVKSEVGFMDHYVFQKPDEKPCQLPMRYLEVVRANKEWVIGSKHVVKFDRQVQKADELQQDLLSDLSDRVISGNNKGRYNWLKNHRLFEGRALPWKSLKLDKV